MSNINFYDPYLLARLRQAELVVEADRRRAARRVAPGPRGLGVMPRPLHGAVPVRSLLRRLLSLPALLRRDPLESL